MSKNYYLKNHIVKPQRHLGIGLVIGLTAPVVSTYWLYKHVIKKHNK